MRRILFPDHEICVQANELFVIHPLQPHTIQQPNPHDYAVIIVKGLTDCPVFHQHIISFHCKQLFIYLLDALQDDDVKAVSAHWNKLFVYLCRYWRRQPVTATTHAVVEKSMAYIAANYQNPITVSNIAKNNCMSVFHYCRMFKSLMGISPHKYLMQYRLSKSYKSLQTNHSVFDSAIDSGFYDSSHFVRNFYDQMSVSPQSYRQSILKNSKIK
jgi:AraC-like DNA-binding protein